MIDLIDFARTCNVRGPCANFVAHWLSAHGVVGVPSLREIVKDWRRFGVEFGTKYWCHRIGLQPSDPLPFAVALVEQKGGKPLLGVLSEDQWFVTRSFGRVLIDKNPTIIRSWRV